PYLPLENSDDSTVRSFRAHTGWPVVRDSPGAPDPLPPGALVPAGRRVRPGRDLFAGRVFDRRVSAGGPHLLPPGHLHASDRVPPSLPLSGEASEDPPSSPRPSRKVIT